MGRNSAIVQYFAAACVNFITAAYGALCGWPSSNFLILQSENSPLESGPISKEEAAWINSILCLGAFFGTFIFGWSADKIGRKLSMLIIGIPQALCWILILYSKNVFHLCFARFLGGLSAGGTYVVVPLYITEISEDRIRGSLGAFMTVACSAGVLLAFVLGNFLGYYAIPWILLSLPIIYMFGVVFLPETPYYLLKNNKDKEGEKALKYLRNIKQDEVPNHFQEELENLKDSHKKEEHVDNTPLSLEDFLNPVASKALLIGIALLVLNQFSGCFAMITQTATIFKESGSHLTPNMSAIVVGIIQLIGSYLSSLLVEKAGRKILISISAIGISFGLSCLGIFSYLKELKYEMSNFSWIPVASLSFAIFIANLGVLNLPFVVISELLPGKVRSIGMSICTAVMWALAFIIIKCWPMLVNALEMHGCMFLFASCSLCGGIFVLLVVPETKGKSLDTILKLLE